MFTKYTSKLLVLLLALFIAVGIIAAKAPVAAKQYDYVSLIQEFNIVYVTQGSTKFERAKVESEAGSRTYNMEPLFAKVNEFEAQGYELVTSNVFAESSGNTRTYVLLRRPR